MERTKIEYIPVKNLSVVWVRSQRPYNEKHAKTISDDFDPDKFDPIVVTKPNGHGIYHIVEGQHRRYALEMYAAKVNGGSGENEMAPCRVLDEADPARAAEIFLGINSSRKPIRPIYAFLVAVEAQREIEVDIQSILTRLGYHVSGDKKKFSVSAVGALRQVHTRYSSEILEKTLRTLTDLWDGDPGAVISAMIRGFAVFVNEFDGQFSSRRLRQQIGDRFSPWKFKEAAEARKQSTLDRLETTIAELVIREYNSGLPKDKKLDHKRLDS